VSAMLLVPDGRMIFMRQNRMHFTRVTLVGVFALGLLTPAYAAIAAPVENQRAQVTALVAPKAISIPAHTTSNSNTLATRVRAAARAAVLKQQARVRAAQLAKAKAVAVRARTARGRVAIAPSRSRTTHPFGTKVYSRWYAQQWISYKYNWNATQFGCLSALWGRESGWRLNAHNRSSGAYGIPQALPGRKMAIIARDWKTNPETQIKWGAGYIHTRYGTACSAWSHHRNYGWY
jgi:hypothetical protein